MPDRTVADIMTRSVITLSPEADIYDAVRTLLKHKITGAPVVGENGRLVGFLSEKDCLKVLVSGALDGLPEGLIQDYMSLDVETIAPSASLYDAVHLFISQTYRRLPVVDDAGKVVGQITRRDALAVIEAIRDDPRLYGTKDTKPFEGTGVDSAMRIARGRRH